MTVAGFVAIGRITGTHGLKGEVTVAQTGDLPLFVEPELDVWVVPPLDGIGPTRVLAARDRRNAVVTRLAGVESIGHAERLVGRTLMARPDDLPEELFEEPFDPTGYEVFDEQRGSLGRVVDTIVTGANDVWTVEGGRFGQVLIPVIDDVVDEIDEDSETIRVRLLPGLIEED